MKIRAKTALSAVSMLIIAAGAAGCGGGSDSSSGDKSSSAGSDSSSSAAASGGGGSASQTQFCGAFATFQKDLAGVSSSSDTADIVKTFKSEAKKLEDAGTPSDISSSAKSGYSAVLDAIQGLPDDATLQDLSNLNSGLSDADKANGQEFETYLTKECPDLEASSAASSSSDTSSVAPSPSTSN